MIRSSFTAALALALAAALGAAPGAARADGPTGAACNVKLVVARPEGEVDPRLASVKEKLLQAVPARFKGFRLLGERQVALVARKVAATPLPDREVLRLTFAHPTGPTAFALDWDVLPPPKEGDGEPKPRVRGSQPFSAADLLIVAGMKAEDGTLVVLVGCRPTGG